MDSLTPLSTHATLYAVTDFQATLQGQTTVQLGDPLHLLDDSNAFWWLVSNQRTGETGYVPAEFIEVFSKLIHLSDAHGAIGACESRTQCKGSIAFGIRSHKGSKCSET